ncbi:MAG: pantetheine-phosphate adenylyltransferase [Candidatus Abyssobacteria bacterium SURF_17]|uniref:Phosphopantetheine adenylyltransferase n=1 Tax=Candidatus Abyssobacteria bacterium SURF_17 TaxID=2093361 RepID=A0A419F154_9BACT|nr:MAG: pantetheine-phosphate adenylyltransferase [Candidatus Abyssubacteria bacterium SURF_17]
MKRIAVYPGSFDPITFGHIDLIERAVGLFDWLIVAVAHNIQKSGLFTIEERLDMIRELTKDFDNVTIDAFDCLLVDYVKRVNACCVVRGLRAFSDFEYEFQMALTNRKLNESHETIFLMTHESYSFISSSLVKELIEFGGDISAFVPKVVEKRLREKFYVHRER